MTTEQEEIVSSIAQKGLFWGNMKNMHISIKKDNEMGKSLYKAVHKKRNCK